MAIDGLKKQKTIIIVAHRLTTVKDCDKIFVLDENKIIAEGNHKELMKTCEVYKNLYKSEEE
ncbi:MAG: ABC transporter ATP-binding protein [Clostridia bacterium]|nr:ABC transporter ATP-binding protein [Clostridia bacterium]